MKALTKTNRRRTTLPRTLNLECGPLSRWEREYPKRRRRFALPAHSKSNRHSPKLSQQWLEVVDHDLLRCSISRDDAVAIVDAHRVIAERLAKEIRQSPAG